MLKKILKILFKQTKYGRADFEQAGLHFGKHKSEILKSEFCVCCYCQKRYPPAEIETWVSEITALCPKCGIDAVIGSLSGLPIDDPKYLKEVHNYYF